MITEEKLSQLIGDRAKVWAPSLVNNLPKYEINTALRISHFLAQCLHESGGFTLLVENLNYSQQGLRKVFPKYFPDDNIAFKYARQPKWIGSRVYAGRMGNGSETSGEGYLYRGRGLIMTTGKSTYSECSKFLYGDERLLTQPELLETPEGAILSACWFWTKNNLNKIADSDNIVKVTKVVNGGSIGAEDRQKWLAKCKKVIV